MDRPEQGRTLYDVLGASPHATQEELAVAYRRAVRAAHPDSNPHPNAGARFQEVRGAWEILGDPHARRTYDAAAGRARERARRAGSPGYRAGHVVGVLAGRATRLLARRLFG